MKNKYVKFLLITILFLNAIAIKAQVTVTFNITPPYSTKLSDYTATLGKMVVLLTNTSTNTVRCYLKAEITGDNGIRISTKANFRPAQPIVLQPGVPLMADIQMLENLYDINSLDLKNITSSDLLLKNGLPEGVYDFCVRAYNYDVPGAPLSSPNPFGCTTIRLTQLEPPLLIKPMDKETSFDGNIAGSPQNIIFSWNIPAGSEPGTQYIFRVVEMLDPSKNPADAINSRTTPAFFETVTNSNIFLYGPSSPPLVEGRKYAWMVTALPGVQGSAYRNNGRSEVWSFTYKANFDNIQLLPPSTLTILTPNIRNKELAVNNDNNLVLNWAFLKGNGNQASVDTSSYATKDIYKYQLDIKETKQNNAIQTTINPNNIRTKKFNYSTTIIRDQILVKDLQNTAITKDQILVKNLQNASQLKQKMMLKTSIEKTEEQCDSIGFIDGNTYTATVTAYDYTGKLVQTATSVPFIYSKRRDEENNVLVKLKGNISYSIGKSLLTYKASQVPVEITIYKKDSADKYLVKLPQLTTAASTQKDGSFNALVYLPASLQNDSIFYSLTVKNKYYNSDGIPFVRTLLTAKPTSANSTHKDTTIVSAGICNAIVYGYSLKLYVVKKFPSYKIASGLAKPVELYDDKTDPKWDKDSSGYYVYKTDTKQFDAGITIRLYRKHKNINIPRVEGSLTEATAVAEGYVEVGKGVTQLEKNKKGNNISFVQFHNLVANDIYKDDEYYIIADQAAINGNTPNNKFNINPAGLNALTADNFTAEEIAFKHSPSFTINKNFFTTTSLYDSAVTATYSIVSKDPPKSVLTGQLVYKWGTDEKQQVRPVSNEGFSVMVGYKIVSKDGTVTTLNNALSTTCASVKEMLFQSPDGTKNTRLLDAGQVMGTGTTDANGNFTISVVNLNVKGVVTTGQLVTTSGAANGGAPCPLVQKDADQAQAQNNNPLDNSKAKKGYEDPGWGTNIGAGQYQQLAGNQNGGNNAFNGAAQGMLNKGANIVPTGGAGNYVFGFNAQAKATSNIIENKAQAGLDIAKNGPAVGNDEQPLAGDDSQTLERFYYIVPNNPHLQSADYDITAVPFGITDCNQVVSFVRDRTLKVTAVEDKKPLQSSGLKVTIFREIQKNKNLPLGEGDNLYTKGKLINPEYKNITDIAGDKAIGTDASAIYNTVYEKLYTTSLNNDGSTNPISNMLSGYGKYFVQVCSDPDQSGVLYGSSIFQIDAEGGDITVPVYKQLSIITGRVQEDNSQLPISSASVIGYSSNGNKIYTYTDDDGYFEQVIGNNLPTDNELKNGINGSYIASKDGYNSYLRLFNIKAKGDQDNKIISLTPGSTIKGRILNGETLAKQGVQAYIKRTNGQVIPTDKDGTFTLSLPSKSTETLTIIPYDAGFYYDTLKITTGIKDTSINEKVYRRKHRLHFVITEPDFSNKPIPFAKLYIGNNIHTANGYGIFDTAFENVSVNNYTFSITGPQGSTYIPVIKNIQNEESISTNTVPVGLVRGSIISGVVTLDGKPVAHAKVYVNINNNGRIAADANALVAYTGNNGNYTITGVPVFAGQKVSVTATLDSSFTISGDEQTATVAKTNNGFLMGQVNLNLTSYKAMAIQSVFGFPLSVEKLTPTKNADEVLVTGTLNLNNGRSKFNLLPGNDVVRISNVIFQAKIINGKKVGIPKYDSIPLEALTALKFRYLSKYNVMLCKDATPSNTELVLTKQADDMGTITGYINIVDNSFKYPSTYLNFNNQKNNLYLAELSGNTTNTYINAVKAVTTDNIIYQNIGTGLNNVVNPVNAQSFVTEVLQNSGANQDNTPAALYHLSDAEGKAINLKFIEFDGIADPVKSYIGTNGKIHLGIGLKCHVENASPKDFTVNVDDVVLDDNTITPATGKPLTLAFEKWNLLVNDWVLDPTKGGIYSYNAVVKTSLLDIPFKLFNLRKDMMVMDSFSVSDITVGGGAKKLDDIDATKAVMVYDTKVGSDQAPHWRFSIAASEGQQCASIKGFSNLPGAVIGIDYIQLLSNDENIFSLSQNNTASYINGNKIASFLPTGIFNGSDFFNLIGTIDVNAPRVAPMPITLNYTKNTASISNISTSFEGKGFVNFSTNNSGTPNITIDANTITINGYVQEKPSKTFDSIPAKFIVSNISSPTYSVVLPKNYALDLSNGAPDGYNLVIDNGFMNVVGNDWDLLTFSGKMVSKTGKEGIADNYMTFKVYGDVQVSGSNITTKGSSPLGDFTMVYDFNKAALHGTLIIEKLELGSATVAGTIEMQIDKTGFYFAGAGQAKVEGPLPVGGTYTIGFLLGDYHIESTDDVWQTAMQYMYIKNNCWLTNQKNQLSGFFFAAGKQFLDVEKEFNFLIVNGYVKAIAGIDANIWANFGEGASAGVKITAYANVSAALMSALTGTTLKGSLDVKGALEAKYENSKFQMDATLDNSFTAEIDQYIPFYGTLSKSVSVDALIRGGTNGFGFEMSTGGVKAVICQ